MISSDANNNLTFSLRRQHRWRMAVSGLVILVAGVALGVAGTLLVVKPGERHPPLDPGIAAEHTLRRMQGELNLTSEQVEQIDTILREHFETLETLREAARPKIGAAFEAMKAGIDAVLTEQQKADWEKASERVERQFRRGMRRGPGGLKGPRGPGPDFRGGPGRFPGDRPDGRRGPRQWPPEGPPRGEMPEAFPDTPDANDAPPKPDPNGTLIRQEPLVS